MAARGVTPGDLIRAFSENSIELPSGRLENLDREISVRTRGKLSQPEEFDDLVIRYENNAVVRLREVARTEAGVEDERTIARYNRRPAVGLGIVKQSDVNTIDVAELVKAEVTRIGPLLPDGVAVEIAYDSSTYIKQAIREVRETVFIAFGLVLLIIFAFLRDFRSTIIPMLAVPVSLIGTFLILSLLGFSVNILTLLALVIAVGVVVDDAIVVLENIFRHVEAGMPALEAAQLGTREITSAIIAITITLVAVFLPIAFQSGTTGILFREFAVAIAGSVVISAFVALTLTPTLCARILRKPSQEHGGLYQRLEAVFIAIERRYAAALAWSVRRAWIVVVAGFLTLGVSWLLVSQLPREFLPDDDKGYVFVLIFAPEGATSEYTDQSVRQAEQIATEFPETRSLFSAVALARGAPGESDFGILFAQMKEQPRRSVLQIARPGAPNSMFMRMLGEIHGAQAIAVLPKASSFMGESFMLVLQGSDLEQLEAVAVQVQTELNRAGFLAQPRINLNFQQPQLDLESCKDRQTPSTASADNAPSPSPPNPKASPSARPSTGPKQCWQGFCRQTSATVGTARRTRSRKAPPNPCGCCSWPS